MLYCPNTKENLVFCKIKKRYEGMGIGSRGGVAVKYASFFHDETQKFWSALYTDSQIHIWSLVSMCSTQVEATRIISGFIVRI